jgi:hypothetical protein
MRFGDRGSTWFEFEARPDYVLAALAARKAESVLQSATIAGKLLTPAEIARWVTVRWAHHLHSTAGAG